MYTKKKSFTIILNDPESNYKIEFNLPFNECLTEDEIDKYQ